jgi:hypothetical protein
MFNRPGGLILYFALIASAFGAITSIGDHFTDYAASLEWHEEKPVRISRVMIGLEAQERSKLWQPVSYTSITPNKVPSISVAELAHNLDEAESQKPAPANAPTHIILLRSHRATHATHHVTKRTVRARPRRYVIHRAPAPRTRPADNLTTAQIILRSLNSDL